MSPRLTPSPWLLVCFGYRSACPNSSLSLSSSRSSFFGPRGKNLPRSTGPRLLGEPVQEGLDELRRHPSKNKVPLEQRTPRGTARPRPRRQRHSTSPSRAQHRFRTRRASCSFIALVPFPGSSTTFSYPQPQQRSRHRRFEGNGDGNHITRASRPAQETAPSGRSSRFFSSSSSHQSSSIASLASSCAR